jgi:D-alanine-D-alanine ligase
MSQKIVVALIFGGRSAEHEVSVASAAAIHANLDRKKFEVRSLYVTKAGLWKAVAGPFTSLKDLARGKAFSFLPWDPRCGRAGFRADIYFPVLHGPYGEDGTIQGLLEMAGVPYVGAGVLGSSLGMDKAVAKALLKARGLPVVPHIVLHERDWWTGRAEVLRRIGDAFALPFFVKPSNLGSSVGISKVRGRRATAAALESAFRYDAKILVEKGIAGREIECSVLGNERPEASFPGEVIPFREFYDYRDKYVEGKTTFIIPARLSSATVERVRRLAVRAFMCLDGAGMARVDFFLESRTNRLYVNEVNTIPGFTAISMYPKLWEASGLPFPRLVERLIELGFERHRVGKACVDRGPG